MTTQIMADKFSQLAEPATLRIERLLPGPIDRVWDYLTKSDLRRRWLASGEMTLVPGAPFELVWRNDELTDPPGRKPDGFGEEHRMQSRIVVAEPPHRLVFTWGDDAEVEIVLAAKEGGVHLLLLHRRLTDERSSRLNIMAGWHAHLDLLADQVAGSPSQPHWDHWVALRKVYEGRLPE